MDNIPKLIALILLSVSCTQERPMCDAGQENLAILKLFDMNNDSILNPYEVLDVLLKLQKEKGELSFDNLQKIADEQSLETEAEIAQIVAEFDTDNDGKVAFDELDEDDDFFYQVLVDSDIDGDSYLTVPELRQMDFTASILKGEAQAKADTDAIFRERGSSTIDLANASAEDFSSYFSWDLNGDDKVTKNEALRYLTAYNNPVEFTVKDSIAYMNGVITDGISAKVLQLVHEHPEVTAIEMEIVPGSISDEENLRACHYVYDYGLTTKLNARSSVASGGTDFFLAGRKRIVEKGAILGVHAWGGNDEPANEVPKDDPVHKKYIELYEKTGVPESFYWYTLEAAPAEGMHKMTDEEIKIYRVQKN
jgi:hypothetical protein